MQMVPKSEHLQTPAKCGVSSGSVLFAKLSTFLIMVENIKYYMKRDLFHFIGAKLLKEVLEQITVTKIGIR